MSFLVVRLTGDSALGDATKLSRAGLIRTETILSILDTGPDRRIETQTGTVYVEDTLEELIALLGTLDDVVQPEFRRDRPAAAAP